MRIKQASIILGLAIVLVAGVLVSGGVCSVSQLAHKQATLDLVEEYGARLNELQSELTELKENRVWLELKIYELRQLGKPVPLSLYKSVDYKTARIKALENSALEISAYLETVRQRLPQESPEADIHYPEPAKFTEIQPMESTPIKTQSIDTQSIGTVAMETEATPPSEHSSSDHSSLENEIKSQGLLEWFKISHGNSGEVVLKTALPILFPSGSAAVADSYHPFLKEVAEFVKNRKAWIVVDGYADTDPIKTKKYPSNFELGATRAANIVHSLVGLGADPAMFKVASTGKYRFPDARPMTDNKSMERYVNLTLEFE